MKVFSWRRHFVRVLQLVQSLQTDLDTPSYDGLSQKWYSVTVTNHSKQTRIPQVMKVCHKSDILLEFSRVTNHFKQTMIPWVIKACHRSDILLCPVVLHHSALSMIVANYSGYRCTHCAGQDVSVMLYLSLLLYCQLFQLLLTVRQLWHLHLQHTGNGRRT